MPPDLISAVRHHAREWSDYVPFRYLDDEGHECDSTTFATLDATACAIGSLLAARGYQGERALLLFPPGLDFVHAFFGCLYGGVTAVPAYPPFGGTLTESLAAVVRTARPRVALTISALEPLVRDALAGSDDLEVLILEEVGRDQVAGFEPRPPRPGDLAFLQFTSGSTGAPRGVAVTHGNITHNQDVIFRTFRFRSGCGMGVLWLPMYHDMGLVGGVLVPAFRRLTCAFMSPFTFLKRPLTWLEAISRYGATCAGGPNFGYHLCVTKTTPEQRAALDLSAWEVAFCGAEPVRLDTMRAFADAFAVSGFSGKAMMPVYGLAETTLAATGFSTPRPLRTYVADAGALTSLQVRPGRPGARQVEVVSCGQVLGGQQLVIADPETGRRLENGRIGEVWLSGPSVADGYWGPAGRQRESFSAHTEDGAGPFLRTDDLGFLQDGELFITGRRRDMVIIRGRNIYPQDIEHTVTTHVQGLRPGCGAAFAVETGATEALVVVQEVLAADAPPEQLDRVILEIRRAVSAEHDVVPSAIALLAPRTIPKTSSGKLRRGQCRLDYLAGQLSVVRRWSDGSIRVVAHLPERSPDGGDRATRADILTWMIDAASLRAGCRVDAGQTLVDAGLGSLDAVELSRGLEEWLTRPVSVDPTWLREPLRTLADRVAAGGPGRGAEPALAPSISEFFLAKAAGSLDGNGPR
ncbi:MAG TPA: fatty acyl-AMP ligase [Kineosporiaceae bacterium]